VVPVTSLRTSVAKEDEREGSGLDIETLIFRWVKINKVSILYGKIRCRTMKKEDARSQ
jgi:hypothetical protein